LACAVLRSAEARAAQHFGEEEALLLGRSDSGQGVHHAEMVLRDLGQRAIRLAEDAEDFRQCRVADPGAPVRTGHGDAEQSRAGQKLELRERMLGPAIPLRGARRDGGCEALGGLDRLGIRSDGRHTFGRGEPRQ
jgi:hypothetical protein